MNKRKTLTFLYLILITAFTINHSAFARCEGNKVISDYSEEEPNSTFSQANSISLIRGVCNTFIGHAGPKDSEYYGNKWCIGGSYILNVCTGDETVISDLYRIDVPQFSKIRIETLADHSFGNIGFVIFQSNGDQFTNFYYPTTVNYAEGTFRFSPDTYYIGVFARKTPDTYFVTAELVDDRPKLSLCSSGLEKTACESESTAKFILNNRNINRGIYLTLNKTNFSSSDSCRISSSNRFVTVSPSTSYSYNSSINIKVNRRYAKSLMKQRQTATATITANCTNGLKIELPVLLTRF